MSHADHLQKCSPQTLAGYLPALAARLSDGPCLAPLYGFPSKYACLLLS
jgi:hypothetical protein